MFDIDMSATLCALGSELSLLIASLLLLLLSVSRCSWPMFRYAPMAVTFSALLLSIALGVHQWSGGVIEGKTLVLDNLSMFARGIIDLCVLWALFYARRYLSTYKISEYEFYVLALLSTLGMHVMALSQHLLLLYLGLELMSLPTYVMVAMYKEEKHATEAAIKYFVMGALTSGLLLFGFSLIYGVTSSLTLGAIFDQLTQPYPLMLLVGFVFCLVGVAFKLGLAPFHMWIPDVYEGAPLAVTSLITSAPKIAGFILFWRIFLNALAPLQVGMYQMWMFVGLLSVILGNVIAVSQSNIRRMLAYSSIAQMGYMILGVASDSPNGLYGALFYVAQYAMTAVAAFGLLTLMSTNRNIQSISDLKGLGTTNPALAFLMMLLMLSMAGIPPTLGFYAKLGILRPLIEQSMYWPAAMTMLFTVIGAYYYLRIIQVMYFEDINELEAVPSAIVLTRSEQAMLGLHGGIVVLLSLWPSLLSAGCLWVMK